MAVHETAAEYLGITPRTLYRLMDTGELPAYRFGRVFRLKQGDVEAFIERSQVEPGTLKHLYPEVRDAGADNDDEPDDEAGDEDSLP